MARWICKTCNAVMKVRPEHLGTTQACAKCGAEGVVTDTPAIIQEVPNKAVHDAYDAIPMGIFRTLLVLAGFCCCGMMLADTPTIKIMGAIGFSSVVICWPLSLIAHESVCSRKALDELLKRQRW